ncbi:MAG: C1 family peptidase [Candidatus Marinimicrobia bacterium]|nr:C1 family peptidase [Candidatus Neomarinimicrobiota bacterium]
MKRLTLFATVTLLITVVTSSAQDIQITPEALQKIQSSVTFDTYTKAMQNAVSNNDISTLAKSRETLEGLDHYFAHKITVSAITDQKSSGRCWLFTALNVLRPSVVRKYNLKSFEFSQSYLFFWDQLEKANLFLEGIINTRKKDIDDREVQWLFQHPVSDGGVWSMMPSLVDKYGIVPKEAMSESYNSENTRMMSRLIRRKLRAQGMQIRQWAEKGKSERYIRRQKENMLAEIYRILVIAMGTPPAEFTWRYLDKNDSLVNAGTFTPQTFYEEVVGAPLKDYVMLMDDPSKDYYKLYEIRYDRNCVEGQNWTFINLPVEKIKEFAKKSILDDQPMYFSCDVGKQLDKEQGYLAAGLYDYEAVFGVSFDMTKKERILTYDSGSTHGMALVGIDTSSTGSVTKWLLENSWGSDAGDNGFLTMTDDWFSEYMFRLVILKDYISSDVLEILKQKPILLPPWDRMF